MVDELLAQAYQFIEARIPGYCYPGKPGLLLLPCKRRRIPARRPLRSYATLYVNTKKAGHVDSGVSAEGGEGRGGRARRVL